MAESLQYDLIDISALKKLSDFFQKEFSSLIDLYLRDANRLMDRLNKFLMLNDLKNIQSTARDLRKSSINVGAIKFSFMMLSLELTAQERRVKRPTVIWLNIEQYYTQLKQELLLIQDQAIQAKAEAEAAKTELPCIDTQITL